MTILRKLYKTCFMLAILTSASWALPEGGTVINGAVNITNNGTTQTITQSSNKAIINWNGFNIDVGELVHFVQPNSISAILNRVVGQDPSMILGAMRANGQVFLINPNGVVFGQNAQIDVGSLVVSTLNITDDDFLAGNLNFSQEADKDLASVINHGTIKIDENGFLVLTGPMVANDGVILAKVGQVALAAGTQNTVSFDPTGMIQVALPTGAEAQDGIVSLSQQAAGDILSGVVGTSITQAGQIVQRDGKTFLEVQSGTVVQAGEVNVDGVASQGAGKILLNSTANTILSAESTMSASGVGENSDGGQVYVLGQETAYSEVGSTIFATGGESGDGGFVEQSSYSGRVGVSVDTSASDGKFGEFLIDPERIIVETGAGTGASGAGLVYLTEFGIEGLAGGLQTLQTEDGVFFESFIDGELELRTDTTLRINLMGPGDGGTAVDFQTPGDFISANSSLPFSGLGAVQLINNATGDINNLTVVVTEAGPISITQNSTGSFNDLNLTTNDGDITINAPSAGDFLGTTALATNGTGDIIVNAGSSNFSGSTNLRPGNRFSLNTNDVNNLQLNVASQLTGATAADLFVNASGRDIQLNGVDATGGSLTLISGDVTQTNQANVNEGTFSFSSVGDIGTLAQPLRVDGSVQAMLTGDIFVESVNDLSLFNIDAANITGTGDNFLITGNVGDSFLTNTVSLTSTGEISGSGGQLSATDITLTGAEVGTMGGFLESRTSGTLSITADNLSIDERDSATEYNITRTLDPSLATPSTFEVLFLGEGLVLDDDGNTIDTDGDFNLTVNLIGDRNFADLGGFGNISITTVADSLGDGDLLGTLDQGFGTIDLMAENVTLTEIAPDSIMTNPITATATNGNVIIDNTVAIGPGLDITAGATGLVDIDLVVDLRSSGGISAPTVILSASDIAVTTATSDLDASSLASNIDITNTLATPLAFTADAAGGSGDITLISGGNIATSQLTGANIGLTASGDITRNSGNLNASTISLDGTNIDAQTFTGSLAAVGTANVTIDNVRSLPLTAIVASTTAGNVSLMTDGDLNVDRAFAQNGNIDIQADGAITATNDPNTVMINGSVPPGNTLAAPNGTITVTGSSADIAVTTSNLVATANNQNLVITGTDNTDINIDAIAANGNITINENGNVTGPLNGTVVDITANSIDVDLGVGVTEVLASSTGGLIDILANSTNLEVTALAPFSSSTTINNTGGNIATNRVQGDTVSITANDDITRVSDVLSGPTSVALVGNNITAQLETGSVTATSVSGDIDLTNTVQAPLTANISTTGTVDLSAQDDIDMNTVSGSQVNVDSGSGALTGTVNATTGLNIDARTANVTGSTPAVTGDIFDGSFTFNGTSGDTNFDAMVSGGGSTITHVGDVTGTLRGSSVDVTAANIDVATPSGEITATATAPDGTINIDGGTFTLEVTATADGDITVGNSGGRFGGGNILTNTITSGGDITLTGQGDFVITNSGEALIGNLITITSNIVDVDTQATGLDITTTPSDFPTDITVRNDSTALNPVNLNSANDIFFTTTGTASNLNVTGDNVSITSTGGNISGGNIIAEDLTLEATNITVNTTVDTITTNAPGNISITNSGSDITQADLIAGGNAGLITDGTANLNTFQGTGLTLSVAQAVTGSLMGNSIDVTGTDINVSVGPVSGTTAVVSANSTSGNVEVNGTTSDLVIAATANNGSGQGTGTVTVTNTGNIATNAINGTDVSITADSGSGDISNNSGQIAGSSSVVLSGNNVTAFTSTPSLTAQNANTINITNNSASLTPTLNASGAVVLTSTGAVTGGDLSGSSLRVSGQSIGSTIDTQSVETNSSNGDTTLSSSSGSDLTVVNSTATNGDYTLNHNGNVTFDRIQATNVIIDAGPTGNITDTSNTIVATGITLTGNDIFVNTQGQIIEVNAQGEVTIANTLVDVSSLTVDAQGNVTFGADGDLTITQVAGGPLVSLTVGGDISANPGAVISGTDVVLEVGGQITPDLDNPLNVQATNSIDVIAPFGGPVLAQGGVIAAALEGIIPANSVIVSSSSGPVYYNGVLLNPSAVTPPVVPPTVPPVIIPPSTVVDQIGQQNGQIVDDGTLGSAANDGLVEASPTQELVAQLTESAGSGGDGATTATLITLEIDDLGELQVSLETPSPFDAPIESSETMTADDVLDLDTGELTDVKVAVYYDAANDQLVMAIDLRADDVIDLDVGDYQEIPINLDYSFLSDPNLILDKLRADDLIDLAVEDLGLIPIKVKIYEDE